MENNFNLNEAQKKAVNDTNGAVLVIAGAGSGKTRVLTARICHLISLGVPEYNILAITFTNKAAAEMKMRISDSLGGSSSVWTSTFHSMCAKILRIESERLGYTRDFSIYTEIESDRVVKRLCNDIEKADVKKKGDYLYHISCAKTAGLSPEEYYQEISRDVNDAKTVYLVFSAYEKELRASNALDFDDLLVKTVELFETCPDVLEKYADRFKYINVDEFQDTNTLQYKIVKLLASKHGNLFVVGDEDQSIYGWRGAEIKNILDFPKDFPNAKVYKLEQNYRSATEILDAANNVIKNNCARNKKTLWSEDDSKNCIKYYEAYSDREESAYVAKEINWLINRGGQYKDIAVLVRVNSITRLFEEEFNLHGIPYKVFGGFRFFERKEIKDMLAYIRLALNPSDNESILRIINYPTRGIGEKAVQELRSSAELYSTTLFGALINPSYLSSSTYKKLSVFREIAEDLQQNVNSMSPVEFMQYAIRRSGIEEFFRNSQDQEDKNRYENVEELVSAVKNFVQDNPDATMSDFMQSVALISDTDGMDEDDYVTIATVHAVKGLEFDTVFIVGLEETLFPNSRAVNNGEIEEERRLMYVAITRAKHHLYAINAKQRLRFNEIQKNPASRFIAEMSGGKLAVRTQSNVYSQRNGQYSNQYGQYSRNSYQSSKYERYDKYDRQAADYLDGYSGYNSSNVKSTTYDTKSIVGATQAKSNKNIDYSLFKKDTLVDHPKFGRGVIISTTGEGEDKTAAIAFKGLGIKRFSLAIAAELLTIVTL